MTRQFWCLGLVTAVVVAASVSCSGNPAPAYDTPPTLANRQEITDALRAVGSGMEAKVVLMVHVDHQGRVRQVRIEESSGDEGLDDAALWVGERMRFEPATYQGRKVPAVVQVPVKFDVVVSPLREPRIRNADDVVEMMATEYGHVEGAVKLRIRVNMEGSVQFVKTVEGTDSSAMDAAGKLVHELVFWPAFKSFRPVEVWVNIYFNFAGPDSEVRIESADT